MALKVKELQAAKPGQWLSDGPAGTGRGAGVLLFRRASSGAMLVYYRYTPPDGERDTMPIGQYDESGRDGMTLAEARARAGELARLYQSGIRNIREHLEAEQQAKGAARVAAQAAQEAARRAAEAQQKYTLRALCDAYVAHLEAQGKKKSAAEVRSAFKCHVTTPHPELADTAVREVTPHQIAAVVRKVHEVGKERMAGILRSYLSAAYNCAKRAPFDSRLPAGFIPFNVEHNPVDNIPAIAVKRGERALSAVELRAYIGCLLHVGRADVPADDIPGLALRLALLAGGQRMAQLLRARVGDWDEHTQRLRLWDGKGKRATAREHLLPLAPQAAELVARLVERAKAMKSTLLFSTHGKVPVSDTTPGKRLAEICAATGGEPFDLRDIRRTCETMLAGMRISKEIRAQLLSHGISGVQAAHYDRYEYFAEKQEALRAWEARLDDIVQAKTRSANVVRLRRA